MTVRRRQSGAVLIIAVLLAALAAMLAVFMAHRQSTALQQLASERDYEQGMWVLKGGVQWARMILAEDARAGATDHQRELWAAGLPRTAIEQGFVSGQIADQQGLFNVNNLAQDGRASAHDIAVFRRLLALIGLDPALASACADWIDEDADTQAGGAEDGYYLRLSMPYRAANRRIADLGELAAVRGFDEVAIERLRRVATTLPERTAVNVNTAPAEVLAALVEGLTLPEAAVIAAGRRTAAFGDRADFRARLPRPDLRIADGDVTVESRYFLVSGRAEVGNADVRMLALLQRQPKAVPSVLWERVL